jgi:ankyrin repeat protein
MSNIQKFNKNLFVEWFKMALSDYENEYLKKFKRNSKNIQKYYERYVELYNYDTESSSNKETYNELEKKDNKYFMLKLTDKNVVYNFKKVIKSPEFNPNMVSSSGITPLMFIFNHDNQSVYENLSLDRKTRFKKNIFKITKMLIEKGADVNKPPYPDYPYSYVTLSICLSCVNSNTVKLIALNQKNLDICHPCPPNKQYISHSLLYITYMRIMNKTRKLDIFEFFLKNGANPNSKTVKNSSCLNSILSLYYIRPNDISVNIMAVKREEMAITCECAKLLIKYGADYNKPTLYQDNSFDYEDSSFYYALHHPELIDIMLKKGLDICYISAFFDERYKDDGLNFIQKKRYLNIFNKYIVKYTILFERNIGCYFSNDITDIILKKLY